MQVNQTEYNTIGNRLALVGHEMSPLVLDDEDRSIHHRLHAITRRRMEIDAEELALLQLADERLLHRKLGHPSLAQYLEQEHGYKPHTAHEYLRVAGALRALPLLNEALWNHELHMSQVRELTRVATADTEYEWIEKARGLSARETEKLVSGREKGDGPRDRKKPGIRRESLRLDVTPQTRAMLRHVRVELERELGTQLADDELLQILCRRALEPASHAATHLDGSGRPAYQTSITTCRACKESWTDDGGDDVEVEPAAASMACCDAEHIGDLDAASPARVTTTVTPRKRRQVFARDGYRCTVPGCSSKRNLDLHHIVFQEDGGSHELSNLTIICSGHHALLHHKKLTITGTAPDRLSHQWIEDGRDSRRSHVGCSSLDDISRPGTEPDHARHVTYHREDA